MQQLLQIVTSQVQKTCIELFNTEIEKVDFQQTRKEFQGDITIVVFAMMGKIKGNPVQIATQIGEALQQNLWQITGFNVVKGFLNLQISSAYFAQRLAEISEQPDFGRTPILPNSPAFMVEFASPNTNKPLHLGHIRNILLGYSVAKILEASGKKVYKTQIVNDRGIHICKSMIAWQLFANGQTPENSSVKGDKLVGNYYVAFDKAYKEQIQQLISNGKTKEEAEKEAPIFLQAQEMLRKWEASDPQTITLWKQMNQWVYDGFEVTYRNLGVDFDSYYYESDTYLLGKNIVEQGLQKGVFYQKEDGSVWCDLTQEGLDHKLVLRSDGTSVYITQDLGTAIERVKDHPNVKGMVYTVGNEQDYHFKVLFLILKKLGFDWAENLYHLSYGMVELPDGKMKSREGTVVDADDLIEEVVQVAKEISQELGKLDGYSDQQKENLYKIIGLGALKYYILKFDPKKTIKFNPKESIDFQGNTGPFIQYAYARIQSVLRKANAENISTKFNPQLPLEAKEQELIKNLLAFPETIQNAAQTYSPALIANYAFDLVKEFNSFYQNYSILGETNAEKRSFRLALCQKTAQVIASAFALLGIDVPERM